MKKPSAFFVPGPLAPGATVRLPEQERRHARARRLRIGDPVLLLDGRGVEAQGSIVSLNPAGVEVRVDSLLAAALPGALITVLAPVLRPSRLSWMIEKATELGAARIVLVASARAQGDRAAFAARERERLARLAREAAKQCGRPSFPSIEGPAGFDDVVSSHAGCRIVLDPGGEAFPSSLRVESLSLWAGPEGGFTPEELRAAESAGWTRARLPGATLRAETAVLAGLALAARAIDTAADRADNSSTRQAIPEGGAHGL